MKIALINIKLPGGAYIAYTRLAQALQKAGCEVKIVEIEAKQWNFLWEVLCIFTANHFSKENLFSVSLANTGVDISKLNDIKEADVIHLHWINHGGLSIRNIAKLRSLGKPIVWTCHDMWPFTGICHHANDCKKYHQKCENCPKIKTDLAGYVQSKKIQAFSNITLVGASQWIAGLASQSNIGQNCYVTSIPNPIDTETFYSTDQINAKKQLGLPLDKQLVLFGAINVADKQKGIDYLIEADKLLPQDISYIAIGAKGLDCINQLTHPVYNLGYIKDDSTKRQVYNAASLFVTPSLAENLPNMIMESMACGTPCVGFNIGGIPEMIDHQKNGYVAKYKDAKDFANGICWSLNHLSELEPKTIEKVKSTYSESIVSKQYIELYESLITKRQV